jgi:NCS1 family nucleobase:cation symporter-1
LCSFRGAGANNQTWIGGESVYIILGKLAGGGWLHAAQFGGQPWTLWLSFACSG